MWLLVVVDGVGVADVGVSVGVGIALVGGECAVVGVGVVAELLVGCGSCGSLGGGCWCGPGKK